MCFFIFSVQLQVFHLWARQSAAVANDSFTQSTSEYLRSFLMKFDLSWSTITEDLKKHLPDQTSLSNCFTSCSRSKTLPPSS
ncbi:hypothetical protein XENORESO_019517 [Xenotaenia resolanae]|uniref:Secreted protein n=1 Tax=Xenotaenia resolanae TaxID=208358 RepID=A0ABV0WL40_9TELE